MEDDATLPKWCSHSCGISGYVVIAPHGGHRRADELPVVPKRTGRRMRINDLHTADVAALIADALGGSLLVNRAIDRNRLDLNRISQVRARAPWFLDVVERLIVDAAAAHDEVRVLVVHGWNINQNRCDLGVGANLEHSKSVDPSALTVSAEFARDMLQPLRHHPDQRLHFTCGDRYPARHRNNFLQLFRRDGSRCDELPRSLAAIVGDRRCQAVQLELGIPLRWPGPQRTRLIDALAQSLTRQVFTKAVARSRPLANRSTVARTPTTAPKESTPCPAPQALQAFDAATGVAVLASIDGFASARAVFGRVAIFLPDGRVALYTGEARSLEDLGRDGPLFSRRDRTLQMTFDGSVLVTPNGNCYVDLEYALGQATLESARVELSYEQSKSPPAVDSVPTPTNGAPPVYGMLQGSVTIGGDRVDLDCLGFSAAREWGAWRRAGRSAWSARVCLDEGGAAVLRSGRARNPQEQPRSVKIDLGGDGYSPSLLTIALPERTLHVRPVAAMSIARPVGPRRRARVTFGPATVEVGGTSECGTGIFEYARLVDR